MISIDKINETINELMQADTTFATCERLAACYTVRDHLTKQAEKQLTGRMAGSEFMQAASGVDIAALLGILDEHLEAVHVMYPREYQAVVDRIKAIKND